MYTKSDWIWVISAIFLAALINRVLLWTTGLPFDHIGFTQTAITLFIYTIDKVYIRAILFLLAYSVLLLYAGPTYGLVFAAFVFGTSLHRIVVWRKYHRTKNNG